MNLRKRISVDSAVCHGEACVITKTTVAFDRILDDIVGRILNVVKPRQVFLLGSAARGQMHDNSDIDLCRMDCIVAKRRNKYIVI